MQYDSDKAAAAMTAKGLGRCASCGNAEHKTLPGYTYLSLGQDSQTMSIGESSLPAVGRVCAKCGLVSLHAASVLGLM